MIQHPHTINRLESGSAADAAVLAAALDLVDDGVLFLGPQLEIRAANARAAALLGRSPLCGESLCDVLLADATIRLRASAHLIAATSANKITIAIEAAESSAGALELTLHAAPEKGSSGLIAILRPEKGPSTSASSSTERDFLTGLPTRAALAARLQESDARIRLAGSQYAILFLDLDAFKQLNDELGHAAGDRVLAAVAERLQAAVRPGDLVARYGGDEFVIVVDEISTPQLARLARRLRTTLAAPLEVAGQWITTSASIGCACGDGSCPAGQVLIDADRAMYREKSVRRKNRRH